MSRRRGDWLALTLLCSVAAYWLWRMAQAARIGGLRSYDIYSFFYPIMVLTARSVWDAGRGFFWNPYQNCGQPLFGGGLTGILYPPGLLFLILPADWALYGVLFFNLAVGSISAYFLCRELGVGPIAAWCGAVTFGFSTASIDVMTYTPLVGGPYAWFPAAMLFCERILRVPTLRRAVALGATLTLALIPGHPQAVVYLYQLIAARLLWEILTRPSAVRLRTLGALALGLTLPPLLGAVQLVPYAEVMLNSLRNANLTSDEIAPRGSLEWRKLIFMARAHSDAFNPFMLVPFIIGGAAFLCRGHVRLVLFYAIVGVLCVDLALGTNGTLFPLYVRLPAGALFRDSGRFIWVTMFCLAVLVGYGAHALLTAEATTTWRRVALVALPAAGAYGYHLVVRQFFPSERALTLAALGAGMLAVLSPHRRALAGIVLAAALLLSLVYFRRAPFRNLLPDGAVLFARADFFAALRDRMTPQDRIYMDVEQSDFSLQQKTGSLFGVPALFDYESVPSRRYAAFFHMMRTGTLLDDVNDWLYPLGGFLRASVKARLLNLTAARFLVVSKSFEVSSHLWAPLRMVMDTADVRVFENAAALARARYVAGVKVVPRPDVLLERLANGSDDLLQVALIEEELPSGFHGEAALPERSTVEFVRDDPEHLVLRVRAQRRGFLFLADQYFPGWEATVNGAPTPIARANHVFRLVEVPAGDSTVEFRYRPLSVRVGALVTAVTLLAVGLLIHRQRASSR